VSKWHETRVANVGLRLVGLGMLHAAWIIGVVLYQRVHGHPSHEASMGELALCALLVASALAGSALLVIGPVLWRQVAVPGRRSFSIPQLSPPTGI
jgi:hypothetical protein